MNPLRSLAERSHWIFDLDGTLTLAVHDFASIRRELAIPQECDIIGYLTALPDHQAEPLHRRLQEIEEELAHATRVATGALELLQLLSARNVCLGVLTRNTRTNAQRTLELVGLDRFFAAHAIIGRDEALPKPEPDGVHQLAELWGVPPAVTVMVGDYLYDLQAGRRAGALTIHVDAADTGRRWPEYADLEISSLEEIVAWLR